MYHIQLIGWLREHAAEPRVENGDVELYDSQGRNITDTFFDTFATELDGFDVESNCEPNDTILVYANDHNQHTGGAVIMDGNDLEPSVPLTTPARVPHPRTPMEKKMNITVEQIPHNKHLVLSTMHKDHLVTKTYIGYTKREARELFREFVKSLK